MRSPITVHPDAVGGLATELAALAAELHGEAQLCRSTAVSLQSALEGHEGWTAGAAGTAWAALVQVLADRSSAVALTVTAAMAAYQAEDASLAGRIGVPRVGQRGPR
jgi:Tfp pilus assembly protein FimT